MRRVSDLPIRHKLTLISLLTTTVALVLAGAGFVAYELVTFRKDLVADVSSVAEIIGYNSASALSFNDASSAEQTLRALSAKPHIVGACIYDRDGHVFATYLPGSGTASFAPPPSGATERFGPGHLDLYRPIAVAGENVGTIYLRTDLGIMRERLLRYALIIATVMVVAILVAFLIASRLQRMISTPVADLVAVTNRVAVNKDYTLRAVKRGDDELGLLIDGFNEMLAQIQGRDAALQLAHDHLEKRVEERTAELQSENAERKRAEAELRAKTALLEAQTDSSIDGILVVDDEGRKIFQNQRTADLWKIPPQVANNDDNEQQLQFVLNRMVHPIQFIEQVRYLGSHPSETLRDELELKDGTVLDRYSAPVVGKDGKHYGRIWGFRDITERKRAEAALEKANQELVDVSRQAGMAEVATSVLHNVGNVLNSVNVSATLVADHVRHTKAVNIAKLAAMLDEHRADLFEFLTKDARGRTIPAYLGTLAETLAAEQQTLIAELDHLCKNVEHIKDIVAMQQSYAQNSGVIETVSVPDLIEDALRINAGSLARHDVNIIRDYQVRPVVTTDKHKVMQILINLVRNAKYACDESGRTDKQITVRTTRDGQGIKIAVIDNGVGIPTENLTRIFNHGFTTRKTGHGFGLHSGALAAKQLGGSLTVQSDGPGHGATFTLALPCGGGKTNP